MSGRGERKMKKTYPEEIYHRCETWTRSHVTWRQGVSFATDNCYSGLEIRIGERLSNISGVL